jgi:bacterioferritin-associated ferredoxin
MQEYGKKGVNVDSLVREQMAKAKRNGRTISYDTAYEEVVADSMEMMLSDGNVMKRLEKLKARDKDLWHKIKSFIDELAAKIRNVYKDLPPDSVEGRYVADMGKAVYKLQELFSEALVGASENYQSSLTPGEEGVVVNENGDPVAHSTEDGTIQLSMRTYEEDGREAFRKYLQKCVTSKKLTKAEMQDMLDGIEEIYDICKDFKDKYAPFSTWSDAAVVRDTHGKPVFSVVTPNGDYKMNLDFSLVCKKRRTLDAVFNEMSRRGIIDDFELGQKSVVKINEIIRRNGLETACALCFVDAKRFRQASMADQFTSLYNELVESLVPEDQKGSIDHFNFSGYDTIKKVEGGIDTWDNSKLDFSHLDHVLKTYGDGTVEYKAAKYIKNNPQGRKLLLRGDFMSSQGFDAVKTQNQDILKLYNSKKGTGGPKAAFGDVQYMNEIIKKARTWTPAKAYAVGGVRIQSFSDYVPRMVFDYVQMIYDLAATKLPAHAYTKEALFVKQFGLTGVKINMSLIPAIAEGGVAPGLDANGNYVWAGESFDYETAKEIQNAEGYTENCGTICVGVSDRHIRKLLSDPDIRMVIPYHKSSINPTVAKMRGIE